MMKGISNSAFRSLRIGGKLHTHNIRTNRGPCRNLFSLRPQQLSCEDAGYGRAAGRKKRVPEHPLNLDWGTDQKFLMISTISEPMRFWASTVAAPICGVQETMGWLYREIGRAHV